MTYIINPPPRQRLVVAPLPPRRAAKFKRTDVIRALEAVRASGLVVAEIEIKLDGSSIRIVSPDAPSKADGDLFSRWEHRL